MQLIKLENLCFKYNLSNVNVLNNINLDIIQGDKILLIGKKGSSKSTLLKMLKPTVTPSGKQTGDISFNVNDTEIAYVPQNTNATFLSTKVISNIVFPVENLGIPKEEIERRLSEICLYLSISNILYKNIDDLSGGERQLVAIASAIITYPKILLLDEPLSELSVFSRKKIMNSLNLLHEETNTTIILCEHQVDECIEFTDKIGLLQDGILKEFDKKNLVFEKIFNNDELNLFIPDLTKLSLKLFNNVIYTPREFKKYITSKQFQKLSIEEKNYSEAIINLKNITYFYDKKNNIIFDELNFTLNKNEKIAIFGDNGAGKTTLIKLITKINKPYSGSIRTNKNKIAYLPQDLHSYFTKETVYQELKKHSNDPSSEELVKLFDLEKLFNISPYDLSSGEALLVCLCSTIFSNCDVLILDEPTKNLDVFSKKIFGEFLLTTDMTVLMSSHDLDFCAKYVENCAFVFNKKISKTKNCKQFMLDNSLFTTSVKKATKYSTTYSEAVKSWV